MQKWIVGFVIVLLVVGGWAWYAHASSKQAVQLRMAKVQLGDLRATIGATGTVEPEEVVDVGSQLSGTLDYFGKDLHQDGKFVDYGSSVDEGEVLAHLDDSLYAADLASAAALVEQGKANVQKAHADFDQTQAKLDQAAADWKRAQDAGAHAGLSQSDIDSYKANYNVALANVADGQAAILLAQTTQAQSEAQLLRAKKNLGYCTITSPVKGTIIDRRVNIGQTVAASLNAPSLFLIAKDLKRMQVWASVNEADIGNIQPGQNVTFTVDAFSGRNFVGTVGKIRLNATMTSNVVTYTVEVDTDNSDGKLLPYLTANVQFEIAKKTNVLMVPNSALRYTPPTSMISPQAHRTEDTDTAPSTQPTDMGSETRGIVWVEDGKFLKPITVQIGLTDGVNTEISADNLKQGDSIVIGEVEPDLGASTASGGSPFLPKFPGRRRT